MRFATATALRDYPPAAPDSAAHAAAAVRGEIDVRLAMRHAGERTLRLRYELVGRADAPVVLVAGGISAHRHLAANAVFGEKGWADGLVGCGRALDPAYRRLLGLD